MNTKTERNWQLIVAGILFIIFGLVCAFFPGLTLASIAFIVGAAFVVSGVVNIATFIRDRDLLGFSGWILAYGILDVLIGAMFVIHPSLLRQCCLGLSARSFWFSAYMKLWQPSWSSAQAFPFGAGCCSRAPFPSLSDSCSSPCPKCSHCSSHCSLFFEAWTLLLWGQMQESISCNRPS